MGCDFGDMLVSIKGRKGSIKDIKIDGLENDQAAALAQVIAEEVLEQLGYTWDYTETSPDCSTILIKNITKD